MTGYALLIAILGASALGGQFLWNRARPGLPDIAIGTVLALCAVSAIDLVGRSVGLAPPGPALGAFAILALAGVISLRRASPATDTAPLPLSTAGRVLSLLLGLVYVAPAMISALGSSMGPWPDHFHHVDTPYYLGHVFQLLRDPGLPPASLSNEGVHVAYHYGVQNIAALISRLAGLPAHKAFFLVLFPLIALGTVAVTWRIADWVARRGLPHWFAMLSLLYFVPYPIGRIIERAAENIDDGVLGAVGAGLDRLVSTEAFGNGFPQLGNYIGLFLTAVMLHAVFCRPDQRSKWLAAFSVAILPLFKSVYLIPAGGLFGLWALIEAWRRRSLVPLAAPAAAFVGAVLLSRLAYNPRRVPALALDALAETWVYVVNVAVFCAMAAVLAGLIGRRRRDVPRDSAVGPVAVASLGLLLLVSTVTMLFVDYRGEVTQSFDLAQALRPAWLFVALAVLSVLSAGESAGRGVRTAATMTVMALCALPVLHRLGSIGFAAAKPEAWHDYVDNRPIAEALSVIPVDGSIIATNSLRYPTRRAHRDLRQLQIPAIFGHQAYAANLMYEPFDGAVHRLAMQRLLQTDIEPERLAEMGRAEGWTHLLLYKREPYPARLPGTVVFESESYLVVRLD